MTRLKRLERDAKVAWLVYLLDKADETAKSAFHAAFREWTAAR